MPKLKIVQRHLLKVLLPLSAIAAILIGFQNCGQMHSSQTDSTEGGSSFDGSSSATISSCSFDNKVVANGASVDAYQSSTVPFGQQCVHESRTCSNGMLSGSFDYATCAVGAPAACLFNGQTVAHGASITAYLTSTVPYGQSCASEARACANGQLSGSFAYASCSVGAPAACMFNGQTIASGASVTAYAVSTVPYGQSCAAQAQTRSCSNGLLSGSYNYGSCVVDQPASCLFNGQTIPHNGSVVAYSAATVPYGQSCSGVMQTRTCSNGSLSGSYAYSTCAPNAHVTCNFPANPGVSAYRTSDSAQYAQYTQPTPDPAACAQFCESHNVKYCNMFIAVGQGYCIGWITDFAVSANAVIAAYGGYCQ